MTTYSYTIVLDDSQHMALKAALDLMIRHCDEHLKDGPEAPYWAQRQACLEIREILQHTTPEQMSGLNIPPDV